MGARANAVGSARIARVLQRGGLALFALLLAVLLVEGGHSLFTGRSLVDRLLLPAPVASAPFDRVAAGALTPGPYALDPDPEVLLRVKPSSRHAFAGVPASTDEFGQRPTIGTPASADRRVVLLGDSVAFGYGVSDEHTHAAQLSRWLAGACPDAASRVSVATLACPGWNAQSAFRALRDHRGRLDPHVVLYIAVANDLDDPKGVDELGWHDIDFEPDPERTACSDERHMRLMQALQGVPSRATLLDIVAGGGLRGLEHALRSGVTPESRRRWDRHVQEIARLHAELATRGAEFAVVLPFDDDYYRQLELRLAAAAPQVRVFGLCSAWTPADSLGHDAHPNPECIRAGAWRIAHWLLDQRLLPCAADALAPLDGAYVERRYDLVDPARRAAELERILALKRGVFWPRIDLVDLRGVHQVYGGLLGDGTLGKHAYVALARGEGTRLRVEFERLPADSGLYPLELVASAAGAAPRRELGRAAVHAPAPGEDPRADVEFELPQAAQGELFVEVLLSATNWVEAASAAGPRPVSARIRSIAIDP